jgi:PEP-CTERM motif-containing protein
MKNYHRFVLVLMLLLSMQAKAAIIVQAYNDTLRLQGPSYLTHSFAPFDTALGTLTSVQFEGITRMEPVYDSFLCDEVAGCELFGAAWARVAPFSRAGSIQTTGHSTLIMGNPSNPTGVDWFASVTDFYTTELDVFAHAPTFYSHGDAFCFECLSTSGAQYDLMVSSSIVYTYTPAAVPLPATLLLMGIGLAGFLPLRYRRVS